MCRDNLPGWSRQPARFRNLAQTVQQMILHANIPTASISCAEFLDDWTINIRQSSDILRSETPMVLNEDNKEVVQHLKTRKRRLLANVLKDLRMMGFKANMDATTLNRQASLGTILASVLHQDDLPSDGVRSGTFYRFLDLMFELRRTAKSHSDDLSNNEVSRSMSFLESILETLMKQKNFIVESDRDAAGYRASLNVLTSLWHPSRLDLQRGDHDNDSYQSLSTRIHWMPTLLRFTSSLLQKYGEMGGKDPSSVLTTMTSWIDQFRAFKEAIANLPKLPEGLCSSLHMDIFSRADLALAEVERQFKVWAEVHPWMAFALNFVQPSFSWEDSTASDPPGPHQQFSMQELSQKSRNAIDRMLVNIQSVHDILDKMPNSEDQPSWLSLAITSLGHAIRTHQLDSVGSEAQVIMGQIQHFSDHKNFEIARTLCASIIPIYKQYHNTYQRLMDRYQDVFLSLCNASYVLAEKLSILITQGFCEPSPKTANESNIPAKTEEGTGLGDGDGAEDISKDIGEDEDLTDLAQNTTNEDIDQDLENEKDAVDMADEELEGKMDDHTQAPDDNEENEDEDKEGEDKNDVDEEVGSVDGKDDDLLDEKIWDEGGDDTNAKQDKSSSKGKTQSELQAQGDEQPPEPNTMDGEEEEAADASAANDQSDEETTLDKNEADPSAVKQEEEKLNLPEDMQLDTDRQSIMSSDSEMSGLSDPGDENVTKPALSDVESESRGENDERASPVGDELVSLDDESTKSDLEERGSLPEISEKESEDDTVDPLQQQDDFMNIDDDQNHENTAHGSGGDNKQEHELAEQSKASRAGAAGQEGEAVAEDDETRAASQGVRKQDVSQKQATQGDESELLETREAQTFKKIGDALGLFHQQAQDILPAAEPPTVPAPQQDAVEDMAEYEHLANDEAEPDAQALGAANEEQAKQVDKNALDVNHPESIDRLSQEALKTTSETLNDQMDTDGLSAPIDMKEGSRQSLIGFQPQRNDQSTLSGQDPEQVEDFEELDNDMSTVNLDADVEPIPIESFERAVGQWRQYEATTQSLAVALTEQLRLILAPTKATKMRGDFRTGKRLNIKRLIPYIASGYKRDKIWMRRSIPSKRSYQIMIAVDDSRSMNERGSGSSQLAFETLALVSRSLSMLEAGQLCILGFGGDVKIAHPFEDTFSSVSGPNVLQHFSFEQTKTDVRKLIGRSLEIFREARTMAQASSADLWQLELIISDGVCEDHPRVLELVRQAQQERVMIIFVIVDALKGQSIMNMNQASFEKDEHGEAKLKIRRYLDDFPFRYYLVVSDVRELPGVLATALRQWFAEVMEL